MTACDVLRVGGEVPRTWARHWPPSCARLLGVVRGAGSEEPLPAGQGRATSPVPGGRGCQLSGLGAGGDAALATPGLAAGPCVYFFLSHLGGGGVWQGGSRRARGLLHTRAQTQVINPRTRALRPRPAPPSPSPQSGDSH